MAAEIERIVDRKLIKARVHYLVVWRGFGEENNTWESRMDLMADGYGAVIKRFEDERKKTEGGATPTRGRSRSPGRSGSTPKSPRSRSKSGRSPGRARGRSRSRSASVGRQAAKAKSASPEKSNNQEESKQKAEPARRSGRNVTKEQQPEEEVVVETTTTQFVTRLETKKADEEDDDSLLLRSTLAALSTPVVREQAVMESKVVESSSSSTITTTTSKTVSLAYEEETLSQKTAHGEEEGVLLQASSSTTAARGGFSDMITKMIESGWLVSFLSVTSVVGSIVAFQVLPRDGSTETAEIGRRWLPVLTPLISLLLFFHQKDARASAKWVAIALAWRCAAELLLLIGETPAEFHSVALFAGGIANTALVVAFGTMWLRRELAESIASAVLLIVGALALFLADSWFVTTANGALESRVILMSLAVLAIALSPVPAAASDEE